MKDNNVESNRNTILIRKHQHSWYLQDSLLVNPHKVQGLVDEVVAQRLEQTLHQRHAEAVNSWPAGGVLGLPGEALLREEEDS